MTGQSEQERAKCPAPTPSAFVVQPYALVGREAVAVKLAVEWDGSAMIARLPDAARMLDFCMNLRQSLERADKQLRELHDERMDRFDVSAAIVRDARELALKDGQARAAKLARVGDQLSPSEGREIIAAMLAALPESKSDLLTIKQAAELANVSERQLYRLTHLHTRVGKAIRIRRSDLRDLGTEFD